MLFQKEGQLCYRFDAELLVIEAWGNNALRVRATHLAELPAQEWALSQKPPATEAVISIPSDPTGSASIVNGKIKATVSQRGKVTFYDLAGKVLLEEYARNRQDLLDPKCSALKVAAREFVPLAGAGTDYQVTARFESLDPDEKIFGMGQYQQPHLDLKGSDLELAQRNSQASVPFAHSDRGYGLLWNSPAVGRAVFGKNVTTFEARSTKMLDYWVVAGDKPAEIQQAYASATGTVPMMPEYGLGFWQSKLRYQSQNELLEVVREYRRRGLPLDVIVADFFHWPLQGDWRFDPTYWPDPAAMVAELKELNVELMVSVWPTVDKRSANFPKLLEAGHLVRSERGARLHSDFQGECVYMDFTSKGAREAVWQILKRNYFDLGVRIFWLDEAEPEFCRYDFDNYRYQQGPVLAIGNVYPSCFSEAFYRGQTDQGQAQVVNLVRCAWAGSQRFGALVWSGDIASSWSSLRNQLAAGLSMGLAGIPWWTSDIGGFHGGDPKDVAFQELLIRWFQWGAFCPVMRLHGDREPRQPQQGSTGGSGCRSGADNEVWSFGEEAYEICKKYLFIREGLRPYTRRLMAEAHHKGWPLLRTMFFEFPEDAQSWEVEDQYMFGDQYLVAPILEPGISERCVYLPPGVRWRRFGPVAPHGAIEGGQVVCVAAPLDDMPVFERVNQLTR